jgi:hypothetical protein
LVGFGKARRFELVDGWPIEPAVGAGVYLGEGSTTNPRIPRSGTGSSGRGPGGTESAMATATGQIQMQLHAVDPFAHDVFCVGSTIKRWYLDVSIFSLSFPRSSCIPTNLGKRPPTPEPRFPPPSYSLYDISPGTPSSLNRHSGNAL